MIITLSRLFFLCLSLLLLTRCTRKAEEDVPTLRQGIIISEDEELMVKEVIRRDFFKGITSPSRFDSCYLDLYINNAKIRDTYYDNIFEGLLIKYGTFNDLGLSFSIIKDKEGEIYFLPYTSLRQIVKTHNEVVRQKDPSLLSSVENQPKYEAQVLTSILRTFEYDKMSDKERYNFFPALLHALYRVEGLDNCDQCYDSIFDKELGDISEIRSWLNDHIKDAANSGESLVEIFKTSSVIRAYNIYDIGLLSYGINYNSSTGYVVNILAQPAFYPNEYMFTLNKDTPMFELDCE